MNITDTTILSKSGMAPDTGLTEAVLSRGNIIAMTQDAENAVLRPKDCGAFGHDMRAAIAARLARQAGDEALASFYAAGAGHYAVLAAPEETGEDQGLEAVLAFADRVANQTKDVTADDITGLQAGGLSDADIVRLCELIAFLAFQVRVVAGLRLMKEADR